jgi:LmbE family N-acetylglucosaminyl deacetylase
MHDQPRSLLDQLRCQPIQSPAVLLRGIDALCVMAPHPDDETLGCGLVLQEAAALGLPTRVICLSDGSRSHPASKAWPPTRIAGERRLEFGRAMRRLAPQASVDWLGYGDSTLPIAGAGFRAAAARLKALLPRAGKLLVLSTWEHDPHCDHIAASRLAHAAVQGRTDQQLLHYPIWGRFRADEPGHPPASAVLIAGDARTRAVKREALALHRTQMTRLIDDDPSGFVMQAWMQRHFIDHPEIFLAA